MNKLDNFAFFIPDGINGDFSKDLFALCVKMGVRCGCRFAGSLNLLNGTRMKATVTGAFPMMGDLITTIS